MSYTTNQPATITARWQGLPRYVADRWEYYPVLVPFNPDCCDLPGWQLGRRHSRVRFESDLDLPHLADGVPVTLEIRSVRQLHLQTGGGRVEIYTAPEGAEPMPGYRGDLWTVIRVTPAPGAEPEVMVYIDGYLMEQQRHEWHRPGQIYAWNHPNTRHRPGSRYLLPPTALAGDPGEILFLAKWLRSVNVPTDWFEDLDRWTERNALGLRLPKPEFAGLAVICKRPPVQSPDSLGYGPRKDQLAGLEELLGGHPPHDP